MRKIFITLLFAISVISMRAAVSYSYTTPICGTLTGSFTNTSTGFNIGYLWYFDDPASGTTNNYVLNFTKTTQSHTFTATGSYKVKLYIINASSQPVDSIEHTIVLSPAPFAMLFPSSFKTYCNGDNENNFITATSDPAYKYVWSPTPLSMSSPSSVEYAFTMTQTFSVIVTDTTTGCSVTKSITVNFVNCDPLTSQFTFPAPQCGDLTVTFKNTSLSSHHYKWYFGDIASGTNDTLSKADSSSVSHTFSDTGTYYVSLVVFDSLESKKDSSTKQVKVFRKSLANIFNKDTTVCTGTPIQLFAEGLGTAVWSPATGLSTSTGYTTTALLYDTLTPTKLYLTTNNNGCVAVDSVTITVLSKPNPAFNTDSLCIDEAYTFNADIAGYSSYRWDFGNGDTAVGDGATYSYDTSGVYNVKLTVSNGYCDSFTTKQVIIVNNPFSNFSPDKFKVEITKANFSFTNKSLYASTYLWDFGDVTTSVEVAPTHTYTDTGWYRVTLTAINDLGCEDTFSLLIRVDNAYKYNVPSAFSPNQSGPYENEVFKALGPAGTTKLEMFIYDRWGQIIFESYDEKVPWLGKETSGKECPAGNYVYLIRFKDPTGKRLIFNGIVTLCR